MASHLVAGQRPALCFLAGRRRLGGESVFVILESRGVC
jgi:hypothetical protein